MQIIIVIIILRGFLGVRVSPRIYRGCIKAYVYNMINDQPSHDVLAQCFPTIIPQQHSCNLISVAIINVD